MSEISPSTIKREFSRRRLLKQLPIELLKAARELPEEKAPYNPKLVKVMGEVYVVGKVVWEEVVREVGPGMRVMIVRLKVVVLGEELPGNGCNEAQGNGCEVQEEK